MMGGVGGGACTVLYKLKLRSDGQEGQEDAKIQDKQFSRTCSSIIYKIKMKNSSIRPIYRKKLQFLLS